MNIGDIVWPAEKKSAVAMYLNFVLNVLKELEIKFPDNFGDPIKITRMYLDGTISEKEYCAARIEWWTYIDESGQLREFRNKEALIARMAICLLGVTEKDVPELGEHLSWFIEVLSFYGVDGDIPRNMMRKYFEFES